MPFLCGQYRKRHPQSHAKNNAVIKASRLSALITCSLFLFSKETGPRYFSRYKFHLPDIK